MMRGVGSVKGYIPGQMKNPNFEKKSGFFGELEQLRSVKPAKGGSQCLTEKISQNRVLVKDYVNFFCKFERKFWISLDFLRKIM